MIVIVMRRQALLSIRVPRHHLEGGCRFGMNYFEINGFQLEVISRGFLASRRLKWSLIGDHLTIGVLVFLLAARWWPVNNGRGWELVVSSVVTYPISIFANWQRLIPDPDIFSSLKFLCIAAPRYALLLGRLLEVLWPGDPACRGCLFNGCQLVAIKVLDWGFPRLKVSEQA